MPQMRYLTPQDLPATAQTLYHHAGQHWHLAAVIIRYDRAGRETSRTAFLRMPHGGREWMVPWDYLEAGTT